MTSKEAVAVLTDSCQNDADGRAAPVLIGRLRMLSALARHRSALLPMRRLASFGPRQISELADGVGVDVSTLTRPLRQLERDDLVTRGRSGSDLRCVQIAITPAAEQANARIAEARAVISSKPSKTAPASPGPSTTSRATGSSCG